MTEFIDFNIWPTLEPVPFLAENGHDGNSLFIVSQVDTITTITLTLSDGTIVIIPKGVNGRGIASVSRTSGTGAAGSLDTYTFVYTSGANSTFTVQNGTNGTNGTAGANGAAGVSITNATINGSDHLILTLSTGGPIDCGVVVGADGISVVSFTVAADGAVTAIMSDASSISVGNIYTSVSATTAAINTVGHLILSFPNGTDIDAGEVVGASGGAISIDYTYAIATADADPGAGKLRLNDVTDQKDTTIIRTDYGDRHSTDWTTVIATFNDSTSTVMGYIRLYLTYDPTKWLVFAVTGVTDATGYYNIAVTNTGYSAVNPFVDTDLITLAFTSNGDKGTTGSTGATGPTMSVVNGGAASFDTFVDTGAVHLTNITTNANHPSTETGEGYLEIFKYDVNTILHRLTLVTGVICTRTYVVGSWGSWYKYTGTVVA